MIKLIREWKSWTPVAVGTFMLMVGIATAEDPKVSGYVETNYYHDLGSPKTGAQTLRFYYDDMDRDINSNAHVAITGALGEQAAYAVEIDAGNEAKLTSGDDDFDIQEAYLTYTSSSKLGLKVGKFATFQGIEVLEGPLNPTISRGYLYGLAECFTHVGGVATYVLGPLDFAAGVVNGWDVNNDNNDSKTAVWKIGYNGGDPLALTLSGYHGAEQAETNDDITTVGVNEEVNTSGNNRSNIDLTGVTKLIPNVDLWFQVNYGQEENVGMTASGLTVPRGLSTWSGAGIQPVIKFSDKFTLGLRLEYFVDEDGVRTDIDVADETTLAMDGTADHISATNFTITPGYMLTEAVGVKAEYRYDTSNKKIFVNDKGEMKDKASSVGLQFYALF